MTDPDNVGPPPEPPPAETVPVPEPPPAPPQLEPAPPRYPFWSWLDMVLLACLTLPLLLLAAGFVQLFELIIWKPRAAAVGPIVAQFLFYALWFFAVYATIRLKYDRPFWPSLAFLKPAGGLVRAMNAGVLTAVGLMLLAIALRPPRVKTPIEELLKDPVSIALMVIFGVTLAPLCEELAFRGLLLPLLVRSLGAPAGILITAAPFAILHGPEYSWQWQSVLVVFLAGSAFGWMRWRSGSTAAATVMHAAYNLVFFVIFLSGKLAAHK